MLTSHTDILDKTEYHFPGQTGFYSGKVRDAYTIKDKYLVLIATDRISAFDKILPRQIPYKGQVLNQLAAYFLDKTSDIVPNWLEVVPDENVSIGLLAEPVKVELVIRDCLVGHIWREYKAGKRSICGQKMPEGMKQYDRFFEPLITPTTKADTGHDEDITPEAIISEGLATHEEWEKLTEYMRKLFARGQEMAEAKGLVLADTKYEFGRLEDKLILIDEVHTPDSSRYFYRDSYEAYVSGKSSELPEHFSKEFVREWLMSNGFSGRPGQKIPILPDKFVKDISGLYIELYEEMTGKNFVKAGDGDIVKRIEANVNKALKELI